MALSFTAKATGPPAWNWTFHLLPVGVYMGSVSKFTAASVVLAAEKGLLSLDDNVRKYVPELPDYGRPITLRLMLHHTSGFRDVLGLLALSGRNAGDVHPTDRGADGPRGAAEGAQLHSRRRLHL